MSDSAGGILVRGVNWLGDAVMTTPALQRLREAARGAPVTLLTHRKLYDLWQNHPSLDRIITFEAGESPWSVARRLRAEKFQTALVLPNSPRSALEAWLAGIPERIGYARPWRSWLLTKAIAARPGRGEMRKHSRAEINRLVQAPNSAAQPPAGPPLTAPHQIHEYLHLAAVLGANRTPVEPKLAVTQAEIEQVEDAWLSRLRQQRAASGRVEPLILFGLNPGAEYGPAKRWPAEAFAAVAREASSRIKNCVWFVFGNAADRELGDRIVNWAGRDVFNIAGRTSLREFLALLKICRVLLTNDTGPMHAAAALGTPVVVPFGSTSPELTGPGLPGDLRHRLLKSDAPCAPCFRRVCPIDFRCMKGISVEIVLKAVLETAADS
jgi:heptosyltransferase-2